MAAPMEICGPAPPKAVEIIRNAVIFKKIANNLPVQTLLHLRETCVEWNKTFMPQIRKKHSPIILTCAGPPRRVAFMSTGGWTPPEQLLEDYAETMRGSQDIPFSSYKIEASDNLYWATDQELLDFFQTCGPAAITSLEFDSSGENDHIRKILYEWTPELTNLTMSPSRDAQVRQRQPPKKQLPNLKRLHFRTDQPDAGILREIMQEAVGLKYLEIDMNDDTISAIGVLRDLKSIHKLKALTGFRMMPPSNPEVIQTLVQISNKPSDQLRLERFTIGVGGSVSNEPSAQEVILLNNFLKSQAPCLRELEIYFSYPYPSPTREVVQIPKMDKLNLLQLCQTHGLAFEFEGRTLGSAFPVLKHLEYTLYEIISNGQAHGAGSISMEELSQLRHSGVTDLVWNSSPTLNLAALRVWFPGVTRLKLGMKWPFIGELATLWNNWPALKSLHIEYKPFHPRMKTQLDLDEILSGVRRADMAALQRELVDMDTMPITMDAIRKQQHKYKTRFSIGDQDHLQKFSVEVGACKYLKFSDIGGYLGFALAPQSLQFQITVRSNEGELIIPPRPWLSTECVELIRAQLGPFAVIN